MGAIADKESTMTTPPLGPAVLAPHDDPPAPTPDFAGGYEIPGAARHGMSSLRLGRAQTGYRDSIAQCAPAAPVGRSRVLQGTRRLAHRLPEVVHVLIAKGLVEIRPKVGTRVLPLNCWNLLDPDVPAWGCAGKPDGGLICSLFELRGIIEPAAASVAARLRERA